MTARAVGRLPAVVLAPAKLTRSLRIVGVRRDGFHLLEAEMVTVSLFDRLEISCGDGLRVSDEVEWSAAPPSAASPESHESPVPNGGGVGEPVAGAAGAGVRSRPDLVVRALSAVGRRALVSLTKRIPAGAGLGGGSADAAAILRWAGVSDLDRASELGADVPFCLVGGRAQVGGIGESVEPLPFEARHLLLVVPRLHVSTPQVYGTWDDLGSPSGEHGNDLEPAALEVEPRLGFWRDLVAEVTGRRPLLAGSGGTWWLEAEGGRAEALRLEKEVREAVVAAGQSGLVKSVETIPA